MFSVITRRRGRPSRPARAVALGALICAALVAAPLASAFASEQQAARHAPVVGGFGLGDGLEGLVDEQTGAFSLDLPLAGIGLRWDSRAVGADHAGFGHGWSITGVGRLRLDGAVRLVTATGDVHEVDLSSPSGLAGYPLSDLRFDHSPGSLPARAEAGLPARAYAYRLTELGGAVSYFSADGDAIAKVDARGNRTDWIYGEQRPRRLVRTVNELGVVSDLDWMRGDGVTVTTQAGSRGTAVSARIELADGLVAAVVDPVGRRVQLGYTGDGLLDRLSGSTGAVTEVRWRRLADGSMVVDRVSVADETTGSELSARTWAAREGAASGWPVLQTPAVSSAHAHAAGYATVVSDGSTGVRSEYDDRHRLVARRLVVTTASGERTLQEQRFTYPAPPLDGAALPASFARPTGATLVHHDEAGATRSARERYVFDEFGRQTERVAADGAVTVTEYDPGVAGEVPIGLPVRERTTTTDGLVTETRSQLDDARTAVVAVESFSGSTVSGSTVAGSTVAGAPGTAELLRTARTEFEVAGDGFVEVERTFPQGGSGTPLVTERMRVVDPTAGTATVTETVAAGTALATTTSTVTDLVHGQPIETVDAVGHRSTTVYDDAGRPTTVTDPAGRTTITDYLTMRDHGTNATVVTAPSGVAAEAAGAAEGEEPPVALVTTEHRDALDRVVRVTDNIDHGTPVPGHVRVAETRAYPDAATIEVTDAWGATTTARQDVFGRPIEATAATGLTKVIEYDDVANTQTTRFTADAELVRVERFDAESRVVETAGLRADGVAVPGSVVTTDGLGRQLSSTVSSAGLTRASTLGFDLYGNPTTTTTAAETGEPGHAGASATFTESRVFDAFGASVEKTISDGASERSGGVRDLDLLGRTVAETDQAGRTTRYAHTPDGLVAEIATSNGGTTTNRYDDLTRALVESTAVSPVGTTVRTRFEYDAVTGAVLAAFDPADRKGSEVAFTYDAWGNTTSIVYPDGRRIAHEFDEHGRHTATVDVAGRRTRFSYTPAGLPAEVVQSDRAGHEVSRVSYAYDEHGRLSVLTRGNGDVTEYAYTSASEIRSERTTRADGALVSARTYDYAVTGELVSRTDTVPADDGAEPKATTTVYGYDAHGRLIASSVHAGARPDAPAVERTSYALTESGDVAGETVTTSPGSPVERVGMRSFAYHPTGELASVTTTDSDGVRTTAAQEYDSAGNLTHAADGTRYGYDARNRRVREVTPDGDVLDTAYWATGQRASLTARAGGDAAPAPDRATAFYWSDTTLVNEAHTPDAGATEHLASYLIGTTRHARTITGPDAGTVYFTHDRHGSVTELTDASGSATQRYDYRDYGVETDPVGPDAARRPEAAPTAARLTGEIARNPFRYAGEHTDPSGSQHLQERDYLPALMRFAEKDRAAQHNVYWFADANPIMHVDPTGRSASPDTVVNSVFTGFGLAAGVVSMALAMFSGGAALGPFGLFWTALGVTVDAWALQLGVGGLLSEHAPELVDDTFEAFFTSETVQWSGTVLGIGIAVAAGVMIDLGPKVLARMRQVARRPAEVPAAKGSEPLSARRPAGLPAAKGPEPLPTQWKDSSWQYNKLYAKHDGVPTYTDYFTTNGTSDMNAMVDLRDRPGSFKVLAIDLGRYGSGLDFMMNADGPAVFAGGERELLEWAVQNGYHGLIAKAPTTLLHKPPHPVAPREQFLSPKEFEKWQAQQAKESGGQGRGKSTWVFRFLSEDAVVLAGRSRMLRYW